MKHLALSVLLLFCLQSFGQTLDPTKRIDTNLRNAGERGLSDQNYTLPEKQKLQGLTPVPSWLPSTDPGYPTANQVAQLIATAISQITPQTGGGGVTPTFTIGSVTTGSTGSQASVSVSGTAPNYVLNFIIPAGPAGSQGLTGSTGANGTNGVTPTFSIGSVTSLASNATPTVTLSGTAPNYVLNLGFPAGATGPQGPAGSQGTAGTNGLDGKTVLNGTTAPSSGVGANGDFYINTQTNTLYGPKSGGAWPTGVSLVGPPGSGGSTPIANNLTTTTTGSALDAAQGKQLKDLVDANTSTIGNKLDVSTYNSNRTSDQSATTSAQNTANTALTTANTANTAVGTKEPAIGPGTSGQYWRGDKSWQPLNSTVVGLGNVPNFDFRISIRDSVAANLRNITFTGPGQTTAVSGNNYIVNIPGGGGTPDATPTQSSTNTVQSGGVYSTQTTQNNRLTTLETASASLSSSVGTLGTNVSNNTNNIQTNTNAIATQGSTIGSHTSALDGHTSQIQSMSATIAALQQQLASYTSTYVISTPSLTASSITQNSAVLSWPASTSANSYTLQQATNSGYTTGLLTLATGNITSYTATSLSAGTTYYWRVQASGGAGTSPSGYGTVSATTSAAAVQLSAPTLTAGTSTSSTIALSWTTPANATGYIVRRATAGSMSGATTIYTGSATSYTATGLSSSTPYYFDVAATGGAGYTTSNTSATVTATTSASVSGPTSVTLAMADLTQISNVQSTTANGFTNSFRPASSNDYAVSNYKIPAGTTGTVYANMTVTAGMGSAYLELDSSMVQRATFGSVNFATYINYNNGNTTWQIGSRNNGTYASGTPANLPLGTTVSFGYRIALDSVYTEYVVNSTVVQRNKGVRYRGASHDQYVKMNYLAPTNSTLQNVVVTGFTPTTVTTLTAPVINTPTNITTSGVSLSWNSVSGATTYTLDRSTSSSFDPANTVYSTQSGAGTSANVTGLTSGTTYYFRVRDQATGYRDSPYSNTQSATTN